MLSDVQTQRQLFLWFFSDTRAYYMLRLFSHVAESLERLGFLATLSL